MPSPLPRVRSVFLPSAAGLLALMGCSTPSTPADTFVADAAEAGALPDVPSAPDVLEAAVDAPSADVAEAGPVTCTNVSGAWDWTMGACNNANAIIAPDCVVQTGCRLEYHGRDTLYAGMITGNTSVYRSGPVTCTTVFTGSTATQHCVGGGLDCSATGVRHELPGASSYCCQAGGSTCGAGQRCQPFQPAMNATPLADGFTACVAAGTLTEGMPCTRTGGRVGLDSCAAGLFCSRFSATDTASYTCQRVCANNATCRTGELCSLVASQPHAGVCRPRCALLGTDCPTGSTCRPTEAFDSGDADTDPPRFDARCSAVGAAGSGTACTYDDDCGANLLCASQGTTTPPVFQCRAACDATHACPTGQHCSAFAAQPGRAVTNPNSIGACWPD